MSGKKPSFDSQGVRRYAAFKSDGDAVPIRKYSDSVAFAVDAAHAYNVMQVWSNFNEYCQPSTFIDHTAMHHENIWGTKSVIIIAVAALVVNGNVIKSQPVRADLYQCFISMLSRS